MRKLFGLCSIVLLAIAVSFPNAAQAEYYPNDGDLWYDGTYFADSYLLWGSLGPWATNDPGYEQDFAIRSHYFEDCSSWTNLPSGYDDCPTAGVSEESDLWSFSFGSFHSKQLQASSWYYGSWNFSGGWSLSSDFRLNLQEVYHQFCWWDSIWCMGSKRTYNVRNGTLNWGQSYYTSW